MENKKGVILEEIKKYFIYFVLFSIIGWLYEVLLELFIYNNGFVNRGFLFGPYCPVYGFGAIIFILTSKLYQWMKSKNGGHAHFPFEKVVLPVVALVLVSLLFNSCF